MISNFNFLLVSIILLETVAQFLIQKHVKITKGPYLLIGLVSYGLVGLIYYHMLNTGGGMAVSNTLWNIGTIVLVTILGWIIFKQKLSTRSIIGVILAMIAGALIEQ